MSRLASTSVLLLHYGVQGKISSADMLNIVIIDCYNVRWNIIIIGKERILRSIREDRFVQNHGHQYRMVSTLLRKVCLIVDIVLTTGFLISFPNLFFSLRLQLNGYNDYMLLTSADQWCADTREEWAYRKDVEKSCKDLPLYWGCLLYTSRCV